MTTDGRRPLASGLTLREEFARSAMVGRLSGDTYFDYSEATIAKMAVDQADALIAALNNPEPDPEGT